MTKPPPEGSGGHVCGGRQAINLNFTWSKVISHCSLGYVVSNTVPKYQVAKAMGEMPSLQALLACVEAGHGILHRQ